MSFLKPILDHANDIALVIYTGILIVWGWLFAVVLRKKWGTWRHSHREPFTPDEWILIGLLVFGLMLALLYMLTFLHGKPPASLLRQSGNI